MVSCSSWLMSASERTLKSHLVSYRRIVSAARRRSINHTRWHAVIARRVRRTCSVLSGSTWLSVDHQPSHDRGERASTPVRGSRGEATGQIDDLVNAMTRALTAGGVAIESIAAQSNQKKNLSVCAQIITQSAWYAVRVIKRSSVPPSACSSVRPSVCAIDRQQQRRPAGLLLRSGAGPQQISVDSCCCGATCGPRKFRSECKEIQHTCFDLLWICRMLSISVLKIG